MAQNPKITTAKRARERARAERRLSKLARRGENKRDRPTQADKSGADPDIAGITPGPQPLQPWQTEE